MVRGWWCGASFAVPQWWCWASFTVWAWWCRAFIALCGWCAGPSSLLVAGGAGLSSLVSGGLGPLLAVHGAGCSSLFMGGVAGCSSFFVGGGAGRSVVVVDLIVFCVPWCVALVAVLVVLSSFEDEGVGSLFVFAGALRCGCSLPFVPFSRWWMVVVSFVTLVLGQWGSPVVICPCL